MKDTWNLHGDYYSLGQDEAQENEKNEKSGFLKPQSPLLVTHLLNKAQAHSLPLIKTYEPVEAILIQITTGVFTY